MWSISNFFKFKSTSKLFVRLYLKYSKYSENETSEGKTKQNIESNIKHRKNTYLNNSQPNRVVVLKAGRHSGSKAIVISSSETGDKIRPYAYCLLVGLNSAPKIVIQF